MLLSIFRLSGYPQIKLYLVPISFLLLSGCQGAGDHPTSIQANVSSSSVLASSTQPPLDPNPAPSLIPSPLPISTSSPTVSIVPNNPSQFIADPQRKYSIDVMLFAGTGTWATEVSSIESILKTNNMTYNKLSSAQLNALSAKDLAQYGLLIFPGGAGGTQAKSLSSQSHAELRSAVQDYGVSYLGFCAGAFIAVAPAPDPGQDVSYGLGIVNGLELDYYFLEYQLNPDVAMTLENFADGSQRDLLWYGGPVTPNTPGGVIARYPNGDPAITQLVSGKGFVIVSGPHPAAPQTVKDSFGLLDSDGSDEQLTWSLISSALYQIPMKAF
jgi:glutamine amidotransferase-like uncharacterized protein